MAAGENSLQRHKTKIHGSTNAHQPNQRSNISTNAH